MRWARLVGVLLLLGCGTSGTGPDASADGATDVTASDAPGDSTTASDGGTTLTGEQAFPVRYTWMDTALPSQECGGTGRTLDGGLAAAAVDLFDTDVSAVACGDGGTATGRVVELGIATTEWAGGKTTGLTQSLGPGTYVVGDQKVPDEDFCMIPSGATAWMQVLTFDDAGVPSADWNGTSGSVIVTTLDGTSVAGTFAVQLGDPNGSSADGGTLSGTFSAAICP
jgi:hypothetical protein